MIVTTIRNQSTMRLKTEFPIMRVTATRFSKIPKRPPRLLTSCPGWLPLGTVLTNYRFSTERSKNCKPRFKTSPWMRATREWTKYLVRVSCSIRYATNSREKPTNSLLNLLCSHPWSLLVGNLPPQAHLWSLKPVRPSKKWETLEEIKMSLMGF